MKSFMKLDDLFPPLCGVLREILLISLQTEERKRKKWSEFEFSLSLNSILFIYSPIKLLFFMFLFSPIQLFYMYIYA